MQEDPIKVLYTPSQELRYELSEDEISRKRFAAVVKIYKEIQSLVPDIPISFVLYGSLAKGKILDEETAKVTDIDLEIFYDGEAADKSDNFRYLTEDAVINRFKKVKDDLKQKDIQFDISPIDGQSIDGAIFMLEFNERHIDSEMFDAKKGIENAKFRIAMLFGLSIGEALKKYRNEFLKKLSDMEDSEEAERIWDKIKGCVEEIERKGEIPDKARHQFPQTLQDASSFYELN